VPTPGSIPGTDELNTAVVEWEADDTRSSKAAKKTLPTIVKKHGFFVFVIIIACNYA
jgi:hypothetical protein